MNNSDDQIRTNVRLTDQLRIAVRLLIQALPRCKDCDDVAIMTRYDATSDPWPCCRTHAKMGGMLGDEQATELAYTRELKTVEALLVDANKT